MIISWVWALRDSWKYITNHCSPWLACRAMEHHCDSSTYLSFSLQSPVFTNSSSTLFYLLQGVLLFFPFCFFLASTNDGIHLSDSLTNTLVDPLWIVPRQAWGCSYLFDMSSFLLNLYLAVRLLDHTVLLFLSFFFFFSGTGDWAWCLACAGLMLHPSLDFRLFEAALRSFAWWWW